jgi:hypothetical protein
MRPQPTEKVGRLGSAAVVHGDAGGDPDRGRALGLVPGAEQFIGQPTGGGAIAGQRERVGQARGQRCRTRIGGGPVQPRRACLLATGARREVGKRGGQSVVAQAVLGHPQREIR